MQIVRKDIINGISYSDDDNDVDRSQYHSKGKREATGSNVIDIKELDDSISLPKTKATSKNLHSEGSDSGSFHYEIEPEETAPLIRDKTGLEIISITSNTEREKIDKYKNRTKHKFISPHVSAQQRTIEQQRGNVSLAKEPKFIILPKTQNGIENSSATVMENVADEVAKTPFLRERYLFHLQHQDGLNPDITQFPVVSIVGGGNQVRENIADIKNMHHNYNTVLNVKNIYGNGESEDALYKTPPKTTDNITNPQDIVWKPFVWVCSHGSGSGSGSASGSGCHLEPLKIDKQKNEDKEKSKKSKSKKKEKKGKNRKTKEGKTNKSKGKSKNRKDSQKAEKSDNSSNPEWLYGQQVPNPPPQQQPQPQQQTPPSSGNNQQPYPNQQNPQQQQGATYPSNPSENKGKKPVGTDKGKSNKTNQSFNETTEENIWIDQENGEINGTNTSKGNKKPELMPYDLKESSLTTPGKTIEINKENAIKKDGGVEENDNATSNHNTKAEKPMKLQYDTKEGTWVVTDKIIGIDGENETKQEEGNEINKTKMLRHTKNIEKPMTLQYDTKDNTWVAWDQKMGNDNVTATKKNENFSMNKTLTSNLTKNIVNSVIMQEDTEKSNWVMTDKEIESGKDDTRENATMTKDETDTSQVDRPAKLQNNNDKGISAVLNEKLGTDKGLSLKKDQNNEMNLTETPNQKKKVENPMKLQYDTKGGAWVVSEKTIGNRKDNDTKKVEGKTNIKKTARHSKTIKKHMTMKYNTNESAWIVSYKELKTKKDDAIKETSGTKTSEAKTSEGNSERTMALQYDNENDTWVASDEDIGSQKNNSSKKHIRLISKDVKTSVEGLQTLQNNKKQDTMMSRNSRIPHNTLSHYTDDFFLGEEKSNENNENNKRSDSNQEKEKDSVFPYVYIPVAKGGNNSWQIKKTDSKGTNKKTKSRKNHKNSKKSKAEASKLKKDNLRLGTMRSDDNKETLSVFVEKNNDISTNQIKNTQKGLNDLWQIKKTHSKGTNKKAKSRKNHKSSKKSKAEASKLKKDNLRLGTMRSDDNKETLSVFVEKNNDISTNQIKNTQKGLRAYNTNGTVDPLPSEKKSANWNKTLIEKENTSNITTTSSTQGKVNSPENNLMKLVFNKEHATWQAIEHKPTNMTPNAPVPSNETQTGKKNQTITTGLEKSKSSENNLMKLVYNEEHSTWQATEHESSKISSKLPIPSNKIDNTKTNKTIYNSQGTEKSSENNLTKLVFKEEHNTRQAIDHKPKNTSFKQPIPSNETQNASKNDTIATNQSKKKSSENNLMKLVFNEDHSTWQTVEHKPTNIISKVPASINKTQIIKRKKTTADTEEGNISSGNNSTKLIFIEERNTWQAIDHKTENTNFKLPAPSNKTQYANKNETMTTNQRKLLSEEKSSDNNLMNLVYNEEHSTWQAAEHNPENITSKVAVPVNKTQIDKRKKSVANTGGKNNSSAKNSMKLVFNKEQNTWQATEHKPINITSQKSMLLKETESGKKNETLSNTQSKNKSFQNTLMKLVFNEEHNTWQATEQKKADMTSKVPMLTNETQSSAKNKTTLAARRKEKLLENNLMKLVFNEKHSTWQAIERKPANITSKISKPPNKNIKMTRTKSHEKRKQTRNKSQKRRYASSHKKDKSKLIVARSNNSDDSKMTLIFNSEDGSWEAIEQQNGISKTLSRNSSKKTNMKSTKSNTEIPLVYIDSTGALKVLDQNADNKKSDETNSKATDNHHSYKEAITSVVPVYDPNLHKWVTVEKPGQNMVSNSSQIAKDSDPLNKDTRSTENLYDNRGASPSSLPLVDKETLLDALKYALNATINNTIADLNKNSDESNVEHLVNTIQYHKNVMMPVYNETQGTWIAIENSDLNNQDTASTTLTKNNTMTPDSQSFSKDLIDFHKNSTVKNNMENEADPRKHNLSHAYNYKDVGMLGDEREKKNVMHRQKRDNSLFFDLGKNENAEEAVIDKKENIETQTQKWKPQLFGLTGNLGEIGPAKSRRKRIKMVMTRKRKHVSNLETTEESTLPFSHLTSLVSNNNGWIEEETDNDHSASGLKFSKV